MNDNPHFDENSNDAWTVCTRCEIEYAEPGYSTCLGCFYDLDEEYEAAQEGDEYDDGWSICSRCNIEYTEPYHSICLDCSLAEQREVEITRCEICSNTRLPDSFLCQDCTNWLVRWEKEQWQDIWRDLGRLMKSLRQMLHWTLVERTKDKIRRLLRR